MDPRVELTFTHLKLPMTIAGNLTALIAFTALVAAPARAEQQAPPNPDRLLARLRTNYAQPAAFAPSALRFPLRTGVDKEIAEARKALEAQPTDFKAQWRLARLLEEAEDSGAEKAWKAAADLGEAKVKENPNDQELLEQVTAALVGAGISLRVVPLAEKARSRRPESWQAQVLAGDAYLRRADYRWRVLVNLSRGKKSPAPEQLLPMNSDLETAEKAYARATELAPSEAAPRAGRITLMMARPLMAEFLPPGAIKLPVQAPLVGTQQELLELVRRNPGQISPVWHTAHFLAIQPVNQRHLLPEELRTLEASLAQCKLDGSDQVIVKEARGLLAIVRQDWTTARMALEAAAAAAPDRGFAGDWLVVADLNSGEPLKELVARVQSRAEKAGRAADWTLLGMLLSDQDRPNAIAALRRAIEIDIDSAAARYNLAVVLARTDFTSREAMHHLRRTLEIQPDHQEAIFTIAVLDAAGGRYKPARSTLERLLKFPELDDDLRKRVQATMDDLPNPDPGTK